MSDIITNIIYAICGFFLGGFVTYKFRIRRYKRAKFIDACIEFREPFLDMLIFLDESRDKINAFERVIAQPVRISDFIEKNLAFQEIAYTIFLPYLSDSQKIKLKEAWQDYKYPNKKSDLEGAFNRFSVYRVRLAEEPRVRKLVRDKINKLLEFAKY